MEVGASVRVGEGAVVAVELGVGGGTVAVGSGVGDAIGTDVAAVVGVAGSVAAG